MSGDLPARYLPKRDEQSVANVLLDVQAERYWRAIRAARTARDARAVQLDRMARHHLVAIVRECGGAWLMGGPETWDKSELVDEILRAEFPEVTHG